MGYLAGDEAETWSLFESALNPSLGLSAVAVMSITVSTVEESAGSSSREQATIILREMERKYDLDETSVDLPSWDSRDSPP